ncbi:MAG: OmpA/MotB domain protein [Hydrocarboniphaga sp.]|uniref:OmpA family protein n=1 Tax=Hydrocarboniphaga sp. TaxID=2033016 RepID=UPI00262F1BE3|nr:OmpA family protein [Hydrocarboniphaga sp.]MDB5968275.1 OmpA/MotB domain protein [Hydrocarboniphaga sp.]
MKIHARAGSVAIGVAVLALTGCHNYVKRDEFDRTVADLRAGTESARLESRDEIASLGRDLEGKMKSQDVAITDLQDRLRLDLTAHFDFDKSELRPKDEQALNDFAGVMNKRPEMQVTVEGFADSAGSPAYNKTLGLKRAEAVREHLIESGLQAGKVKAVSYGDQKSRQLAPGAWGQNGQANRRVALVVEKSVDQVGLAEPGAGPYSAGNVGGEVVKGSKGAGQ